MKSITIINFDCNQSITFMLNILARYIHSLLHCFLTRYMNKRWKNREQPRLISDSLIFFFIQVITDCKSLNKFHKKCIYQYTQAVTFGFKFLLIYAVTFFLFKSSSKFMLTLAKCIKTEYAL